MSIAEKPLPKELTPQETATLLVRILERVENPPRRHWLQIACAIVLSLTTVCSTWCAYQSKLWAGMHAFLMGEAVKATRDSSTAHIEALQLRAFDASMGIRYMQAKFEGNHLQEKFLFDRFSPEMKNAVEAWLKTDPFNNPAAPPGLLKMAEYAQPELAEAKRLEQRAAEQTAAAHDAFQTSDTYVLLTVILASALFFGGLSATLDRRRLRAIFLSIGLVLFMVTVGVLATMPICKE